MASCPCSSASVQDNLSMTDRFSYCCQGRNFLNDEGQSLRMFKLFWRLYKYSPKHDSFQLVPGMPRHLPRQIRRALETLHLINTSGLSQWHKHGQLIAQNNNIAGQNRSTFQKCVSDSRALGIQLCLLSVRSARGIVLRFHLGSMCICNGTICEF